MKRLLFCLFVSAFSPVILAQKTNIEQIKNSNEYYWGEGEGETMEEAEQEALAAIVRSISSYVYTGQSKIVRETENSGSTFQSDELKTRSFAALQDVRTVEVAQEGLGSNAKAFKYVLRKDVEKMFDEREARVIEFAEQGMQAEKNLLIDDALRNYTWAYVLARTLPSGRQARIKYEGQDKIAVNFLPEKIRQVVRGIRGKVVDCEFDGSKYLVRSEFTYSGHPVAGLRMGYFDGSVRRGPLDVKDGVGEMEIESLPQDNRIDVNYEYLFAREAKSMDEDLKFAFDAIGKEKFLSISDTKAQLPVKVDVKRRTMQPDKKNKDGVGTETSTVATSQSIASANITVRETSPKETVTDDSFYASVMKEVESAIRASNPEIVRSRFTEEGYKIFELFLKRTGKVSLVTGRQQYEFVRAKQKSLRQVLARFCNVKVQFKGGRSFMEKLVFRFDEESGKINSLAFGLTDKAERDIFNAQSQWPEVSKYTVLQFLEDYQTAYALKRIDYLDKVFSDKALIMTGAILKNLEEGKVNKSGDKYEINFAQNKVKFTMLSKEQFINRLRNQFKTRDYIHLTFEDNESRLLSIPSVESYGRQGFTVQISQLYVSSSYSDKGYLTLMFDVSGDYPIIWVRLWQPDKKDFINIQQFISSFSF